MLAKKLESAAKAVESAYIEDVFSTYVYTGVGANTWNNGIDLSTKGGAVWVKCRSSAYDNVLFDTVRGSSKQLITNATGAETTTNGVNAFTTTGFSTGSFNNETSLGGEKYASWTFRKQPKFFDIVTYTGNGVDGRAISHNLGAIPRFIIVKRTDASAEWRVYAYTPTGPQSFYLALNTTGADGQVTGGYVGDPSATTFPVYQNAGDISTVNANGGTYVAYLFASNAGGFGASGNDNVITCGSYVGNASTTGPVVTLGYEPQWVMVKNTGSSLGDWNMADNMRGMGVNDTVSTNTQRLRANVTNTESTVGYISPTATGFQIIGPNAANSAWNASGETYIYIAIRRGPMRTPTIGTSVFKPSYDNDVSPQPTGFPVDMVIDANVGGSGINSTFQDKMRLAYLSSSSTGTESAGNALAFKSNTAVTPGIFGATCAIWAFRRAPGFFDQVCYTGDGTNGKAYNHNLTVVPTLVIVKGRSSTSNWKVLYQPDMRVLTLNTTAAYESAGNTQYYFGNDTIAISPTATQFTVSNGGSLNVSGTTYVAYLFATCAGVSKVGSYTGNGSSQTINCGFTGGARFVMIKRTDDTSNWIVWDTARGIVSGNDPRINLNTTAAEVTTDDSIDPDSSGFIVNQLTATNMNVSSGTYIYLAIA